MIPISFIRKILFSLAPLALFYLLKRGRKENPKKKTTFSGFDKSKIVEGEIVEEKK